MRLADHAANIYSQTGEDGVLAHAVELLRIDSGLVIEFGAGDGLELSNTAQFWRDRGWPALLVEPDDDRYAGLAANTAAFPEVAIIQQAIEPSGPQAIDALVGGRDVAVMSIDMDDGEYQTLAAMCSRPALLLVEFNYTMPHDRIMVGAVGSRLQCSAPALVALAVEKGYTLICVTGCNCLFVRTDLAEPFGDYEQRLSELVDPAALTYVVTDWLGRYVFIGPAPHGISTPYSDPQWEVG